MVRRLGFPVFLIVAGFVGGVVVTGWVRAAETFRAAESTRLERSSAATAGREPGEPAVEQGRPSSPDSRTPSPERAAEPRSLAQGGPDFTRIAGQAVKGVANISSLQVVSRRNSPFDNDPFFRYFFGDDQLFGGRDRRSLSLGSGVIISADGYVVTNNHVVGENMRQITIALPDKREIKGEVIGTDPDTDIALLKIAVSGLPILPWGDSSSLKVGEWVLAIGSPFQLSQTVTAGIVSATGRANMGFANYEDFIQTDAAINPGNSGGALINSRGELVGINTGIYSESGGYQGIGFAVPSNLAKRVVGDLMKYGAVRRGSIGYMAVEKLTPQLAEEVGAPNTNGALVARLSRQVYDQGVHAGDVIVGFNGTTIDDPSQFLRLVSDSRIGSTATLKILRNGRTVEVKLPIVSSSSSRTRR
jgi:Do/DeqQ family serine protease